jgi:hypothetical protein
MKRFLTKSTALVILTIMVIAQFGLLGWQWHSQKNTNDSLNQQLQTQQENITSASNGLSYEKATVAPAENKIYLPEFRLALPITTLGLSLVYSPDTAYVTGSNKVPTGPVDEAAISTLGTASSSQSQTQFNCSELVRIRFQAKANPYNPNEIAQKAVTLADGRVLQIYSNHLKNCAQEWKFDQVNADAIAALFQQAASY